MAKIVDNQNKDGSNYENMYPRFDKSLAFKTACELVFKVRINPQATLNLYYILTGS